MRKVHLRRLKFLSVLIWLGALLIVIGLALMFANHTLGIPLVIIGGTFLVRGYIYDSWFRKPPSA